MTSKEHFLERAISERMAGDDACGVGDPYPHDVASRLALEAFFALGGTEEEAETAWGKARFSRFRDESGAMA